MTSNRPYLIRAFYEWITNNNCTPYIVINAEYPEVMAPSQYVDKGQMVLNISMTSVQELQLGNDAVSFQARFSGIPHNIYIPVHAVLAIYAKETNKGMVFPNDDEPPPTGTTTGGKKSGGSSHLTVIK